MGNNSEPHQISLFDFVQDRGVLRERERERVRLRHVFDNIVSVENLLVSWQEFLRGKRKRKDVIRFSLNLIDNILSLHEDLLTKKYKHGRYYPFKISDPKPRDIHKAKVRDRLVHHAIYRILYPYFDRKFIYDSYSCRLGKGTHKAMDRFRYFAGKVSCNNTRTTWVLKCDIKKFFASIDHKLLNDILGRYIDDSRVLWLLTEVIESFHADNKTGVGLPLGNLTSQVLINIYMNEFDQFVKRKLKIKYYARYADDFVILYENKPYLLKLIPEISIFLEKELKLSLHPKKVIIKTFVSGVDFLGWVHFPRHRVLRTATKRRMIYKLYENQNRETSASYQGLLSHGNTNELLNKLKSMFPESF